MSVIRIISASGEGNDRADCRSLARWNACGGRIAEPLIGITAPGDVLMVGDVVGTVSPDEALAVSGITNRVSPGRLGRRLGSDGRRRLLGGYRRGRLLGRYRRGRLLGLFLLGDRKADAARNDEGLSDLETGVRRNTVLFGDFFDRNLELVRDGLDRIHRFDGVYDAGNRRNLDGLSDLEGARRIEIVRPYDRIHAHAEFLGDEGKVVSGFDLIGNETVHSGEVAFVIQDDAGLHEAGIFGEQRFGRIVFICGNDRGFVIIPYGRLVREPEGRERGIDRKDENDECGKDLEPPDDPEYSVLLKYVTSASMALETGPYVHFEPHSENLGIKIPTTGAENRARAWELIATLP